MSTVELPVHRMPVWRDPSLRKRCVECLELCLDLVEHRWPGARSRATGIQEAASIVGRTMRLSEDKQFALSLAARFHDIGMTGIPASHMNEDSERHIASSDDGQKHAMLAARLINKSFPDFADAVEGVWYHHERYDGSGPFLLSGVDTPLTARIIALLLAVEAQVINQPGLSQTNTHQVVQSIRSQAGTALDPSVFAAFESCASDVIRTITRGRVAEAKTSPVRPSVTASAQEPPSREAAQMSGSGKVRTIETPTGTQPSPAPPKNPLLALRSLPPLLDKKAVHAIVNGELEIRPLNITQEQVLATASSPTSTADDVALALAQDPALALRILKTANSSLYNRGRPIQNLKDAVSRMGIREIHRMVLALTTLGQYLDTASTYLDVRLFWEHSIATGLIAANLGSQLTRTDTGALFLMGMLHDAGRLLLVDQFPQEYAKIQKTAQDLGVPLALAEAHLIHLDHCEMLRLAAHHWNIPRELVAPMIMHHKPIEAVVRAESSVSVHALIITLANRVARAMLLGDSGDPIIEPIEDLIDRLHLKPQQIQACLQSVPEETKTLKLSMLSHGHNDAWVEDNDRIREVIKESIRPIHICKVPETNIIKILFDRISDEPAPEHKPNLLIVYLRDDVDREYLAGKVLELGTDEQGSALPVLVVHSKGKVDSEQVWLKGRRNAVLRTPVQIGNIVAAVKRLLLQ